MPRRIGHKANAEIKLSREAQWRYLIRNDDFRKDIRALRGAYREDDDDVERKRELIIEKWNLSQVPAEILQEHIILDDIPRKLAFYEKFLDRPPIGYPVEALLPLNSPSSHYLNIKVDLNEPIDLLLHLITETLREHRPDSQGRRRLDKATYQLAIYDLVEFAGNDFDQVARIIQKRTTTLKGRLNSVRSAYIAAKRKIYGAIDRTEENLENLHNCDSCPICKKALKPHQLCAKARRQFAEVTGGIREFTLGENVKKIPNYSNDQITPTQRGRRLGNHPNAE